MTWFRVWIEITSVFVLGGIEIDLTSVLGSKLTWLLCGYHNWFGCRVGVDWLVFCVGGRSRLGFCMWSRNRLIFAWVVEVDFFFSVGDGTCLDFSLGMELIWLLWRWSKLTWFQCRDRNWLGFIVGMGWLFFYVGGRNRLVFCMRSGNHLVLEWASKLTCFSCGSSQLTWFQCEDRNWLGFVVAVESDLFFLVPGSKLTRFLCQGLEVDLIVEWGSKLTWFQ